MLFTLRTTHMPAAGWRLRVDGVEIVWRCTCAHPQDTGATGRETAAARIMKEKPRDVPASARLRQAGGLVQLPR